MDANLFHCAAAMRMMETLGAALAATTGLGETGPCDAGVHAPRVDALDSMLRGKPIHGWHVRLSNRSHRASDRQRQRARRRRRHAVWLPGRLRVARRVDLTSA